MSRSARTPHFELDPSDGRDGEGRLGWAVPAAAAASVVMALAGFGIAQVALELHQATGPEATPAPAEQAASLAVCVQGGQRPDFIGLDGSTAVPVEGAPACAAFPAVEPGEHTASLVYCARPQDPALGSFGGSDADCSERSRSLVLPPGVDAYGLVFVFDTEEARAPRDAQAARSPRPKPGPNRTSRSRDGRVPTESGSNPPESGGDPLRPAWNTSDRPAR